MSDCNEATPWGWDPGEWPSVGDGPSVGQEEAERREKPLPERREE